LDDDDRAAWFSTFGLTYRYVQWQPGTPSRRERRAAARRQRLRNDGSRKTF
jgi:hypothetical protein